MYLQTKKVVVIFIVTIITFSSIIVSLYNKTQDTIPQISVVSSEELSYQVSFAQNIFGDLSIDGSDKEQVARYGASVYQISDSSSAQFTNIVTSSEMTIVIGDNFNGYLTDLIDANEDKQFVLVENSNNYNQDNVYQINIDYNQAFDLVNKNSTDEDQSLLVITTQYSDLARQMFIEHDIASNPNVRLEVVEDTADVSSLNTKLKKDINNGFNHVYSLDPYNNSDIMQVVNDYNTNNQKLRDDAAKASQVSDSEATDEEVTSEAQTDDQSVDVSTIEDATFKYLTLNQNYILNSQSDESIGTNIYDVNEVVTELINSITKEKLKSGDIEISITNI